MLSTFCTALKAQQEPHDDWSRTGVTAFSLRQSKASGASTISLTGRGGMLAPAASSGMRVRYWLTKFAGVRSEKRVWPYSAEPVSMAVSSAITFSFAKKVRRAAATCAAEL